MPETQLESNPIPDTVNRGTSNKSFRTINTDQGQPCGMFMQCLCHKIKTRHNETAEIVPAGSKHVNRDGCTNVKGNNRLSRIKPADSRRTAQYGPLQKSPANHSAE